MSAGTASKEIPALPSQHLPRAALRGQDQGDCCRARSSSRTHYSGSRCRWRSVNSFMMAAAVSSIERRVTSSLRPAEFCTQFARIGDFVGDRFAIDVIVIARRGSGLGAHAQQPFCLT